MKKVKKTLSFVLAVALLVTACLTDGFGVFAGLMDSTANTSVKKIDIANQALRFYLSDNDYGTSDQNNATAAGYKDYNYWENVLIYTDDDTSKTLLEAYTDRANSGNTTFYNLWKAWGTFAVSIDADSISNAVKVVIPAGTQFPSKEYTKGASSTKKAYVTTEETIFINKSGTWEKYIAPTPVDTTVTKVDIANGAFRFKLSVNDYGTTEDRANNTTADSYTADYNYMSKIVVYTDDTTSYKLKQIYPGGTFHNFYNLWGDYGTFAVQINTEVLNAATKVVIPAGTEFPSYAYTTGASTSKIGYVTTAETIYINKNGTWEKYIAPTPVDTTVTKVDIANGAFRFKLSANDYGTTEDRANNTTADSYTADYNYMSKIVVYTDDTTSYKLKQIYPGGTFHNFYNLWGDYGTFAVQINTEVLNAATKVVIPAGTEFPSYNYTTGASADKIGYVTTDEVIYVKDGSAWKEYVAPIARDTSVTALAIANNGFRFTLSENDYGTSNENDTSANSFTAEYNYLSKIVVYTDDTTSYTLQDVNSSGTDKNNFYNLWTEWGTFTVQGDTTVVNAATKVVIPAGTEFPSKEYTMGASKGKISYVTTADITFKKNGSVWEEYVAPVTKDTSVTELAIANNAFRFRLSNNDYADYGKDPYTNGSNTSANAFTAEYNYLDKILVYTDSTTSYKLKDQYTAGTHHNFFNLWTEWGTFAVQINTTVLNAATKVVIPAGTEFPSYGYTTKATKGKISYVTTDDITFVKKGSAWEEYIAPTTEDTSVTALDIANGAFRFTLSNSDYGKANANDETAESFTAEYNYLDNILVYTDDATSKKLSEVYSDKTYYNLWKVWGTFAVGANTATLNAATKVVIPAGTTFPSKEYTMGATTVKKSYVTTDEITFVKKGDAWVEYVEHENRATNIEKIHVRNGFVLLFLSNHDYASAEGQKAIGDRLSAYNLTDNIMITTAGGTAGGTKKLSEILGSELYYNIWGETGCVALKMGSGYDGTTVTRVAVKKGTEFPAYAYTSTTTKKVTSYVTSKDYVFITSQSADVNTEWTKTIPHSTETKVEGVTVAGKKLTFTLSENDYTSGAVGNNHTDFDYWNKVKVYTDDTTSVTLGEWADSATATYGSDTLSLTGSSAIVRVVIPAKTVFPSYKYTSGQIGECVGYYVPGEVVFENQDGTWTNVSVGISNVSGDVNGDNKVNSQDLVAMAKYVEKGYRYNEASLTYDDTKKPAENKHIVRRIILGDILHNYKKESDSLTYFSSSDIELDSFLNDFYKRQIGYNDYVEGDMTVNSYKPGTHIDGVYNMGWTTAGLTWLDTANSMESDRLAGQKKILENVIVDDYGYVWAGDDTVEDPSKNMLKNGAERTMEWPFPNATLTDGNARFWEFHADTNAQDRNLSEWTNNIGATIEDGLYKGTTLNKSTVEFEVKDTGLNSNQAIINTQYAPWLAIDLRMNTADYANIADVQVSFTTSSSSTASYTTVKASEVAALKYEYTENYAHELWFPMYQNSTWIGPNGTGTKIYRLKIEIIPKTDTTLSGTFALNYVRPSFDTRDPNTNGTYISSLKQYFDYTGDKTFLNNNIAKARRAMDLYMEMYNSSRNLIDRSYFYGHKGQNNLAFGVDNGYWDTLYKPVYDFETNMYFYQALKDLAEMEEILGKSAKASSLNSTADAVLTAMRKNVSEGGFYNESTGRFAAGKNYNDATVDYGYTTWNLQAIELGIATDAQAVSIMNWLDGTSNLYDYEFAPRTATVNDKGIYGWLATNKLSNVYDLGYGNDVQFGGAIMFTSYYDLTSRIQVNGADDALGRLKGIQSWYNDVSAAYKSSGESVKNFYLPYFTNKDVTMQNGTRGTGNGAVGIDGEFTESLLVAAAIPYGFFGMDSEGGNTLCVSPSLPSTMDRWKVENMQYNGVTYDLSIYKDAVRIDSVRGTTTGLKVKVTLDCPSEKDVYVNDAKVTATKADGKATVTVDFADAIIEVK